MAGAGIERYGIVVVDDYEKDRDAIADALADSSVKITRVGSYPELKPLQSTPDSYGVFLLDVMMNMRNQVRQCVKFVQKNFPKAFIIILTSHADKVTQEVRSSLNIPVLEKSILQDPHVFHAKILELFRNSGRINDLPGELVRRWTPSDPTLRQKFDNKWQQNLVDVEPILDMVGHVVTVRSDGVVAEVWGEGVNEGGKCQTVLFPLRAFAEPDVLSPGDPLRYQIYWHGTKRVHDIKLMPSDPIAAPHPAYSANQERVLDIIRKKLQSDEQDGHDGEG